MSLRHLNKRIENCSQEMDKQRRCVHNLLAQQKSEIRQQVQRIPLPAVLGIALVSGFLAQRLLYTPTLAQLLRLIHSVRLL